MRYVIDRFEEGVAVLEDENKTYSSVLKTMLPVGTKEGDVLIKVGDSFLLDEDTAAEKAERIKTKMKSLWK